MSPASRTSSGAHAFQLGNCFRRSVADRDPDEHEADAAHDGCVDTGIVRQAYELFCELGYRATTMELIAERAGVAVQTVYFAFRTKDELLRAVHEWTVLGDDPTPPQLQDWHAAAMAEPDARSAMPKIVAGCAIILARMAPMVPVFNAVSHDAAGAIYQQSEDMRRRDMAELVEALAKKTPLRKGVTRRRAADLIFVLTGPMSYRGFVIDSGCKPRDWVRWVSGTLCHDLFADPGA